MKVLFIGGSGNISTSVSRMAIARGMDLTLLNRGKTTVDIPGARWLTADFHDLAETQEVLSNETFDVVVDWIAFTPQDIERDLALFAGKTGQFVFISSASAYQKPPSSVIIRESTPLHNPYWQYSRNKIACEERLMQAYREQGFPMTIVRPSHTYGVCRSLCMGMVPRCGRSRMLRILQWDSWDCSGIPVRWGRHSTSPPMNA